ncbi:hypothetical protein [Aeromonas allosaccharophila]
MVAGFFIWLFYFPKASNHHIAITADHPNNTLYVSLIFLAWPGIDGVVIY